MQHFSEEDEIGQDPGAKASTDVFKHFLPELES